ncbi:MAG: ABC transporter permease [Thermoflexales bacterium]|nr:ABC transporter permease [Thermoflexales bacterium]
MRRYILRRLVQIVITFFVFITLAYFLLEAQPGDYGQIFLSNPRLTQAQREALRATFGLDRPVHERYFRYMRSLLSGNLGISFSNYPRQVIDIILERAPRTLTLFLTATVVSFTIGFFSGKVLAWKRGKTLEYVATVGGVTLYTVFTPWFGLMMIWIFAATLKLFPIGKFITPTLWREAPIEATRLFQRMLLTVLIALIFLFFWLLAARRVRPDRRRPVQWLGALLALGGLAAYWIPTGLTRYILDILHHLVLPVFTLTCISFAGTMLLTRNSMLETLREDYIMAARAKGLPEKSIRDKHAARNAMLPVVTSFVFSLAFAIDGGVITETIFSWPGMGLTLLEAALTQDIPMVMGGLVFTGTLALTAHLVADILYAYLDPRIRYG